METLGIVRTPSSRSLPAQTSESLEANFSNAGRSELIGIGVSEGRVSCFRCRCVCVCVRSYICASIAIMLFATESASCVTFTA